MCNEAFADFNYFFQHHKHQDLRAWLVNDERQKEDDLPTTAKDRVERGMVPDIWQVTYILHADVDNVDNKTAQWCFSGQFVVIYDVQALVDWMKTSVLWIVIPNNLLQYLRDRGFSVTPSPYSSSAYFVSHRYFKRDEHRLLDSFWN